MRINVHLLALLFLGGFLPLQAVALEVNYWPVFTSRTDDERDVYVREMAGPIFFHESRASENIRGIRPLLVDFDEKGREAGSFHVLYPLFNARHRPYGSSWDLLTLLRYQSFSREGREASRSFQLFPILFWHSNPNPEKSYFGVFPIAGSVGPLLSYDRISWILFPLTARMQRGEVTTLAAPWPFIRFVNGPETSGFHLWPLYGKVATENRSSHRYWLWPLGYSVHRELWKETPMRAHGFLPFYAYSRSERAVSRSFIWPFFGFTDSRAPEYHERRYFWPLFVQRRGDSYINRWAPFYTHSIRSGRDTRWVMWPFHRQASWEERGLRTDRTQFLYFLYWSQTQASIANPDLAPAIKKHVWPFYSYWDNGAGKRQLQALSPFEVFFPFNDVVRAVYSPLFAFYRMDVEEGVRSRHSFLFNFIATRRRVKEESFDLDIGPLFSYGSSPDGSGWEFLKGLISYSRRDGERSFGAFWFNRPAETGSDEDKVSQHSHE